MNTTSSTSCALMFLSLTALAGLGGCTQGATFKDNIDLSFDFIYRSTSMSTPYVQGASVDITMRHRRDLEGWTAQADPDVFRVKDIEFDPESPKRLDISCKAVGAGVTDLEILDEKGRVREVVPIEVGEPDEFRLYPAGPLFVQLGKRYYDDEVPRVLVDGTAAFQVRFYDDGRLLSGNGVLEAIPNSPIEVDVDQTFLFEDRDWLFVTPAEMGAHSIDISAASVDLGEMYFDGATVDAIDRIELYGELEVLSGDEIVILAQALDKEDNFIYGVEYAWEHDGRQEEGLGDLYRYEYEPNNPARLEATFEELTDMTRIHGEGEVGSSLDIGCNYVSTSAGLWFLLVPLAYRRRSEP